MLKPKVIVGIVAITAALIVVTIYAMSRALVGSSTPPVSMTSALGSVSGPPAKPTATSVTALSQAPLFAYYYIWFDVKSWDRAKIDYPMLGRYSSDDESVMRQHVKWAKEAGIQGFIVGWKSTPKLNARLEKLLRIADEEDFKILMIYQALDFERAPLTIDKIGTDMDEFIQNHIHHPSLQMFSKPVMIWSGTWKYSAEEVQAVTQRRRDQLLILGTAKSVKDYVRVATWLDGNAYYWSSVNVDTNDSYESKLGDMAAAIHARQGLWIAPAAPGFDARLVGGTQTIGRKNGSTLRQQLLAATNASPDAIGLISWNEFSENTYIEPSEKFGRKYLDVIKLVRTASLPSMP